MIENPTISTIIALLGGHEGKPLNVYTIRRSYVNCIFKHVNGCGDLIVDVSGTKIFIKRTGIISFEIPAEEM